jgi:hypothetical protein
MLGNETKWYNISKHLRIYDKKHKYFKNLYYTEDIDFAESHSQIYDLRERYYANECVNSDFSYIQFNIRNGHGIVQPSKDFTTYNIFKGNILSRFCEEYDDYDDELSDFDNSDASEDTSLQQSATYKTVSEFIEFIEKDMCTDVTTIDKNLNVTIKPGQKITKLNFIRYDYILKFKLNPSISLTNGILLYACAIAERVVSHLTENHDYNVKHAGDKHRYGYDNGDIYMIEADNIITSHNDELYCWFDYST